MENTRLLHTKSWDGKGLTNEEIRESLKQVILAPSSFTQLKANSNILFRHVQHILWTGQPYYQKHEKMAQQVVLL